MRTSSAIGSRCKSLAIEQIFPSVNHHSELRAPIAEMIVADDFVAEESGNPRERIAQENAANVTDMHWLRDVGRAEIDDDVGSRRSCARHAESLIVQ